MTTPNPIGGLALGTGRFRLDALDAELEVLDAWVINQPFRPVTAFGTRSLAHLREAMAAAAVSLTAEELAWLEHGEGASETARTREVVTWS